MITTLSFELLGRTWNNAEKLLNTAGSVCGAPGMQDAMYVASESGGKPHIVCKTKKGNFACDEACLAWRSQKLCSHVLAVCEEKKCLEEFLTAYRRSKITGNYTAVSTHSPRMLVRNQIVQSEKVHLSTRSQKLSLTLILLPTVMHIKLAVEHLGLLHFVLLPLTLQHLLQAINLAT